MSPTGHSRVRMASSLETPARNMKKLIRIHPGLYRSEAGGVTIIRMPSGEKPWVARWKKIVGQTERCFATLAEARKAVS